MNDDKKVALSDMQNLLQAYQQYEDPDKAFDILLYGWVHAMRHGAQWLSMAKRRNWLSYAHAKEFAKYCLQKDWRIMMPGRKVIKK